MNEHWEKTLKKEADHILFEELSFDDRLKEKVREKIKTENQSNVSNRKWWQKKWSAQIAAASIVVIVTSLSFFQLGDPSEPIAGENEQIIDESPSVLIGDD